MKNFELARMFEKIADALEIKGENQFKVIAYRKVSRILKDFPEDIEKVYREGRLRDIPGIGEGIAKKISEYLKTGEMKKYREALEGIPQGLLELLDIPNLGPKTIKLAHEKLGVENLEDLKRVIEDGSLAKLPGMGAKKVENIRVGIEMVEGKGGGERRFPMGLVTPVVEEVVSILSSIKGVEKVIPAGSYRRCKETVGDLDFLTIAEDREKVITTFTGMPMVSRVIASGETKASVIERNLGIQMDLRVLPSESFGAALQYFTGSKAHNIKLRGIAKDKGLKISEYGVFKGEKYIAGRTEEEVYRAIGLVWIPPEMREDRGEVELAMEGKLPEILKLEDIKGDLHIHSKYSDGADTIEKIAKFGKSLGYEYVGIADHSRSVKYAGGMEIEDLYKKMEEIETLNKKISGITILMGTEVDILQDGSLDYPDEVLEKMDFVIAAVHQGFKKNVTERMLDAMDNPNVDIIAHPTGRLLSGRTGYNVDIEKVMEKAAETGVALEINAYYDRLDLDDTNSRMAKQMGVKLIINTDAHNIGMMRDMRLGVCVARRAWLKKEDVLNTLPWNKLKKALRRWTS
ncbi:DNA polymerase/3'-5' exonuclease PolX [bacterium]|nr:MAG: DNA polymerase/3'-5' exonuclease PolX [bacterium]